ncbi:PAS domain S-box-containing protein [Methanobacterium petrolearium]|nr:PAS domain S-box-containing protein [Methanobacterium petrolearium]BDZ70992.1 hypothetical protein GCM10025861_15090 [Methanobacterium petrolearium]
MKNMIHSIGHDTIYTTSSVENALKKSHELNPDLILMDIILHGKFDGVKTIAKMDIPIVYIITPFDEPIIKKTLVTEPCGYLLKPVSNTELKVTIQLALYKHNMEVTSKEYKHRFRTITNKLHETEIFLKSIYHDSQLPILVLDIARDGNYIISSYNDAFERATGIKKSGGIGENLSDFAPVDLFEVQHHLYEKISECLESGETIQYKNHINLSEIENWWLISLTPLKNVEDEFYRIIITIFNITEHKQIENISPKSEENYRLLVENLQRGVWRIDKDGYTSFVNESMTDMLGYTIEEMMGKPLFDFVDESDVEFSRKKLLRRKQGLSEQYDFGFIRKDGVKIYTTIAATPLTDKKGTYQGSLIGVINITERKKTEMALKESKQRLSGIIEFLPDATFAIDNKGKVIAWNKAIENMTGFKAQNMIGKGNYEYSLPFYGMRRPILIDLLNQSDESIENRYRYLKREGNVVLAETEAPLNGVNCVLWGKASPLYDDEGHVQGAIESIRDVTERKKSEKILQTSFFEQRIINDVVMELTGVKNSAEIYSIIAEAVRKLLPDSYIIVRAIAPDQKNIRITEILGHEHGLKKLEKIVGIDLFKIKFPLEEFNAEEGKSYQSGELTQFEEGIYGLTLGKIPRKVCNILEKKFNIDEMYNIGFSFSDENYGGLAITLPPGKSMEHENAIETIVNQASIAIQRSRAEEAIKESLREKDVLLREINHRVKNNMQIVSSLLNLQTQHVEKEETIGVLKESQGRVKSMAMIHEKLYQSRDLSHINFKEYVEKLVFDILYSYGVKTGTITPIIQVDNIEMGLETAIPLGLIINELVTNSIKYAFPQKKGTITIALKSLSEQMQLTISDDGIGLPADLDPQNTETLGLQLLNSLVHQIDANVKINRDNGTEFKIVFNELNYKKRIEDNFKEKNNDYSSPI